MKLTTDDIVASMSYAPGDLVQEKPSRTVGPPKLGLIVAVDQNPDSATAWVVWGTMDSGRILELVGFGGLKHWEPQLTVEQATYAAIVRKERERYGFRP